MSKVQERTTSAMVSLGEIRLDKPKAATKREVSKKFYELMRQAELRGDVDFCFESWNRPNSIVKASLPQGHVEVIKPRMLFFPTIKLDGVQIPLTLMHLFKLAMMYHRVKIKYNQVEKKQKMAQLAHELETLSKRLELR